MPTANVMINEESGVVPRRPIATRPVSSPATTDTRTAHSSATPCGNPAARNVVADSAATTAYIPWLRFTTRVTR